MIFDWDDYSTELCSEINELNEYLPLYAFINTHSTFDVSLHEMRMVLYFFEYGLNAADDIAQRIQQYTAEYIDTITPPLTKALFNYVREGKYTFCTPGHMAGTAFQKPGGLPVLRFLRRQYPEGRHLDFGYRARFAAGSHRAARRPKSISRVPSTPSRVIWSPTAPPPPTRSSACIRRRPAARC